MSKNVRLLTDEEILAIARKARPEATKLKLGGLAFIRRHCGMRMRKVKVFLQITEGSCFNHRRVKEATGWAHHVCRCAGCGYNHNSAGFRTALFL